MNVSVVIPAYNEAENIAECLQAVKKEVQRSGVETEIIVVNNASTDETASIAEREGVMVVTENRKGITFARSAGFAASTGELIVNVDADTRMPEGWFSTAIPQFTDSKIVAVSGPLVYYDAPAYMRFFTHLFYRVGYAINYINGILFRRTSLLQGGNFIVRRTALESIGGFDTSISFYGEDIDIGRRMSRVGKVVFLFSLPMNTSGRRLMKEGLLKTGLTYAINFFSITFFKKPHTKTYTDVRL